MAWSVPRTWIASEMVTAAIMNQHVRDNLAYLHDRDGFVRVSGGISGLVADLNFRIYNLSSPVVNFISDPQSRFSNLTGGGITVAAGIYQLGWFFAGPAASYESAWCLTYNGSTIDSISGNGVDYGALGTVQPMASSGSVITDFFSSTGGNVKLSGFTNSGGVTAAGLWASYLQT